MSFKKILAKSYIYLILLLLYLPLFVLVVFSFTESETMGQWTGFTFKLYAQLFSDTKIMTAMLNTIVIGLSAAVLATLFGTLGAIGFYNMKRRSRTVWSNISQIPVLNADIVTAVMLLMLAVAFNVPRSNYIVLIIAQAAIFAPFVVLNIMPRLNSMNPNTYEAALDLGASPMRALWTVIIPQLIPAMISSFVLCFTLSIDDFVVADFLADGYQTISTYIYANAKKGGFNPRLRSLSSLIFIVIFVSLLVANLISQRAKKKQQNAVSLK